MLGHKERDQGELFITGSLRQLLPDDSSPSPISTMRDSGSTFSAAKSRRVTTA